MKLINRVLFIVLFILTKIGDSVIVCITSIKSLVIFLFSILLSFLTKVIALSTMCLTQILKTLLFILKTILSSIFLAGKKIVESISFIVIHKLPHLFHPITKISPSKFTKRHKKHSHSLFKDTNVSSSPTPFHFAHKMKYFLGGAFFSLLCVFLPLLFILFLQDLPNPKIIQSGQIPQTTKIYDRNNQLLYQMYATENRTLVPLSDIPQSLKDATIAIEDKDFYSHPGFDISAIIRSALSNASGKQLQGGSTITQQLIKSTLLTPETSVERKIKEIILAFWAERIYTKDQILEMYFNQVPYGGNAWGVEAASELYFGKKVYELSFAESTFLAGIPRAPTIYSPYGQTPTAWKKRQKEVLDRMVALGYITKEKAQDTQNVPLVFQPQETPLKAPHFSFYIKDLLIKKFGLTMVEKGGLIVKTSLDLSTQTIAEKIVKEEVEKNSGLNLTNGASLVVNPSNGDILAMVGSRDYHYPSFGNVNITTSLRQPGSSIKVVTYALALTKGYTAATLLDDTPVTYALAGQAPYIPVNYDGKFHGKVTLRNALGNSFNIPAVRLVNSVGVPSMIQLARNMGIKSWNPDKHYGLSITLGAAETTMIDMASVYATLANEGSSIPINPILSVTNYKGEVLEEKGKNSQKVLDSGASFLISHILADNSARIMEFGSQSPLVIPGKTVSVKTGTSDNKRDNWTIGYTKEVVVAVWVGNNDNSPMSQKLASGITGAAPIWNRIMTKLLEGKPNKPLIPPSEIIQKKCYGKNEYFIKGTETKVNCTFNPFPSITPSPVQ